MIPVISAAAALLGLAVLRNMVVEEARTRVERLPFAIARLAARRIPPEWREEILQDWLAELHFLLSDQAESGPITRLIAANRWALSMLLRQGGVRIARELSAGTPPDMRGFEDIRQFSRGDRRRFGARTARLSELSHLPAEDFDDSALARLASATAVACEALVTDRAERVALALAAPLVDGSLIRRLGPDHPGMLDVRRSHAHALLQLGHPRAEELLRELHRDETGLFGRDDPRTFGTEQLLWWAVAMAGRLEEAEAGLLALESRMPNADPPLLRHIQCKRAWIQGELGKLWAATQAYGEVSVGRSSELGTRHSDTLDARHSVGKMLVRHGDAAQARRILRPVFVARKRLQGRRHPDTLETEKYLALAGGPRVRRRLRRILKAQIRVQGADHPRTRDTLHWLGERS